MTEQLIDDFGRRVRYVRISVTDRCDFRCVYCMSEEMTFLPRAQVLRWKSLPWWRAPSPSLASRRSA